MSFENVFQFLEAFFIPTYDLKNLNKGKSNLG